MTKMNFRAGRQNMSSGLQNGSTGAAADEILRGLFPAGAIIDPEKLEYSFATPYNGPPVERPLPKAPLAFYIDGTAKSNPLKLHIPVAQPLTDSSAAAIEYAEAAPYLTNNSDINIQTSEIEELIITSPSLQHFRRTPSFEGTRADSSTLPYSESEPQSGELPPTPSLDGRSSSRRERDNFRRKRGQCYRCHKGHRLTEKEICLVCGAKYCVNCVLIVMGSMPEGRKCEDCVGQPILEARRPYLGRPSRLLKRLLSSLEIQQCMKTERECAANQLQPEQVFVNGRRLVAEEMAVLLTCVKLKPGRYWYDKASGLWGKEGEKADAVITPELKVGGPLQPNASNGSTQVFLNCREVTKSELKMLKALGVQCTPPSYLVLYPDGRYGDEGQKEIKGNLWNKTALKLLQPFFSFPTPRAGSQQSKSDCSSGSSKVSPAYLEVKDPPKILLLGHEDSGRSTIFNQTKILQNEHFSSQEVQKYKEVIVEKVYQFLSILLEAQKRFEKEDSSTRSSVGLPGAARSIYSLDEQLKDVADRFLDDMSKGHLERTLSEDSQSNLLKIWSDPAIRETYKRKEDLHSLPEIADDLLNRVLQRNDYVPSEADILWAEGLEQGTGLAELEFTLEDKDSISDSNDHQSDFRRYQLISIGAANEFRKWLDMFEDVKVLVYCVAISDYDQTWTDSTGVVHNKLVFSRDLFFRIVGNPCFQDTPLVLLLNKFDKFEEKVTRGVPLTSCDWFSDYSPVGSSHSSQVQQAYMYVVHKYKRLLDGRRVYTLQLNALDKKAVCGALEYVQQILKCEEEKKAGLWNLQDESMYGDTSSFMVQQQQQQHHHLENR